MTWRIYFSSVLSLVFLALPAFAREWKSANGKFSIEAEFVAVKAGKVQLKKKSGEIIEVALNQLSEVDRTFVATASKNPAAAPAEPLAAAEGKPGQRPTPAEWLEKPLTFDFSNVPLKSAIDSLNVQCVLDAKALSEAGIAFDAPVAGSAKGGPALDSLNAALSKLKLTAELQFDVIFVTTEDRQSSLTQCRCYRVKPGGTTDRLIQQITSQTAPKSWDNVGGRGSIVNLGPSVLVIAQTGTVHREIEKKYARQIAPASAPAKMAAALVPTKGINPLAKMRETLRRPTTALFMETPLKNVVADLAKTSKAKVILDSKSLAAVGVSENTPVTIQLRDVPLDSVMSLVGLNLGLTWTVDGDQLVMTTPEAAESRKVTINYDVRDLTAGGDFDSLIDAITSTVHPASWQDVGGPGKINMVDGGLSIAQTLQTHRMVETWLADVRTAMRGGRGGK